MTNNKLEIAPMAVTIDRLTVGGKQMTKSVFNQIQVGEFYYDVIEHESESGYLELRKDMILGYVILQSKSTEEKWYIWADNGKLRKGIFGVSQMDNAGCFSNELKDLIHTYNKRKHFLHQDLRLLLCTVDYEESKVVLKDSDFNAYVESVKHNFNYSDSRDVSTRYNNSEIFNREVKQIGTRQEYYIEFYVLPKLTESGKTYLAEYMRKAQSILDYINDMQLYIAI